MKGKVVENSLKWIDFPLLQMFIYSEVREVKCIEMGEVKFYMSQFPLTSSHFMISFIFSKINIRTIWSSINFQPLQKSATSSHFFTLDHFPWEFISGEVGGNGLTSLMMFICLEVDFELNPLQ